ncbi:hypothetical protein [Streptomyces sp. NPDC088725]|uniref:hypothetical protein n=1 Tax=Streptomyces sp. NPDC088725 TaxID=3365873 RepID=UPI0037F5B4BF
MQGLTQIPTREVKIRTGEGKEHIFDSEREARASLPEYGAGATIWTREVYRVFGLFTRSPDGWKQIA